MYKLELLLTEEDAKALLTITRNIAGHSKNTPRSMTNALGVALYNAGVRQTNLNFTLGGTLRFTGKPPEIATRIFCEKVS